jgi:hypothetical protein
MACVYGMLADRIIDASEARELGGVFRPVRLTVNWLRVLGTVEVAHIGYGIRQPRHSTAVR